MCYDTNNVMDEHTYIFNSFMDGTVDEDMCRG